MKAVAFGLLLIFQLSYGASALDCGSPRRERTKEWLDKRIQQGAFFLRATAEGAVVTKGEKDAGWLEILITLKASQVAGNAQPSDFLDKDGKLYIKFDLWVDGERRKLISNGLGNKWISQLPSLWEVLNPKDYEIHGELFRVVESNSCVAMSIDGIRIMSPDLIDDLNWKTITE